MMMIINTSLRYEKVISVQVSLFRFLCILYHFLLDDFV